MIYNYKCEKCDDEWEEIHPVDDRDKPCNELVRAVIMELSIVLW